LVTKHTDIVDWDTMGWLQKISQIRFEQGEGKRGVGCCCEHSVNFRHGVIIS